VRGRLWCIRLLLLVVVSAVVFSPLAVRGAGLASQPIGWNHDPATLMLPSSPTYPAVLVYRDVRLSFADRSFEKSELLLGFANQDAAAICTMAQRQDFVSSANHAATYQQTFDRCVGWLVIAKERGNDVSYLLSRVKNDAYAQQAALGQAIALMPDWSREGIDATRAHVTEVLLEAVQLLEGTEAAQSFVANMALLIPELAIPEVTTAAPSPSLVVVHPASTDAGTDTEAGEQEAETPEPPAAPAIISLTANSDVVQFNDAVGISCSLGSYDLEDISYAWWCSRGDLVASGTEATWTAPERAGTYEVNLTVTDGLGRQDTESVEIQVVPDGDNAIDNSDNEEDDGEPAGAPSDVSAEINGLVLTADHEYLDESMGGGYSILVSRSCEARCVVDDAAGLEFEWTATGGGTVVGSGDTVRVTVPASPGYVKLTVTTTNGNGEQDSEMVTLYVTTCTYCF
jgi:hypothetical protein